MQKYFIMAVRDRSVDSFEILMQFRTIREGVRVFADAMRNPESKLSQHPDDYDLYVFGTWLDTTGEFQVGVPRMCAIGKDQMNGPVLMDEFGGM